MFQTTQPVPTTARRAQESRPVTRAPGDTTLPPMRRMVFALCVGLALPALGSDPKMTVRVERLSERVLVLHTHETAARTVAIAGRNGVLVVDPGMAREQARRIRERIEREFGRKDIRSVVNTHHHFDHTLGNSAFEDVPIVAHENCAPKMRSFVAGLDRFLPRRRERTARDEARLRTLAVGSAAYGDLSSRIAVNRAMIAELETGVRPPLPTRTFDDRLTLELGTVHAHLIWYGHAHTAGDILVHVPEEKLLIVGDLFFADGLEFAFPNSRVDVPRWLSVLDALLDGPEAPRHIVAGHGGIGLDGLRARRDGIRALWEGAQVIAKRGADVDALLELCPTPRDLPGLELDDATKEREHRANASLFLAAAQKDAPAPQ